MTIREGRLLVQGKLKVRTWENRERLRESGSINRVERVTRVEGLMKKSKGLWLVCGGVSRAG